MNTVQIEAYRPKNTQPVQFVARVCAKGPGPIWKLHDGAIELESRVAASCLLLPGVGDKVLAVASESGCWILVILERTEGAETNIETDGDLVLRSVSGQIRIDGELGLTLRSAESVQLHSSRFKLSSRAAELLTGKLSWVGNEVSAYFQSGSIVGRLFSSMIDCFSLKSRTASREVTELDEVRAGNVDYRADNAMNLRARTVLAKGEELAKLDGGHIHLG
ncbi:MAG: DUF3540 domain-containing protein [Wenzhouxiangella sp.]|nr:DUF3540 domain-containing protein [Wenzhouxiangella sp.]MCH8478050.1 DUF3540 domain-containing protein [Wenzhouxiangella sp.]TVR92196.1 MAG: DUF3540 domain-containing protein [Wenzhouxiangellaceae bacterium]